MMILTHGSDLDGVEQSGFHAMFENIHPFTDGNRPATGRWQAYF